MTVVKVELEDNEVQKNSEHWYSLYRELEAENAELKSKVEELKKSNNELSDALERGNDILEQKVETNILLRERLDEAIDVIKKLLENIHISENLFNFTSQSTIKAERFLEEFEK